MATNFPGSADSFTNPTSGSSLSSPSHADQHTNVNDAVEAIETALLDGAPLHIDDANQRVGIGTTSPAKKLHVKGDDEGIRIEDGGATDHYDIYRNDITGHLEFTGSQTSFSGYDFEVNNGTNVMRIANSGNVGINDTTPSYKLDVNGDINAQSSLRIGGDAIGEWTTFSPLIGQGFNHTYTAAFQPQYTRVGDMVHYIGVVYNFQGTAATGYPLFVQLPVASAGLNSGFGVGVWYDQSTPDQYMLQTIVVNSSYLHFRNTGDPKYFGETGTGSSMLLAQWDSLSWSITYKAA